MRQLNFIKPTALTFNGMPVSDHNRSPLSISFERIENKQRTQRGGLRKYHRADKRTVACTWESLPENDNHTVDKGMGANELKAFFSANKGGFTVAITYDTGVTETLFMVIDDFSMELTRRYGDVNFYNASITLEEI